MILHLWCFFLFCHIQVIDISNGTFYISSHIYIIHNSSSCNHAIVRLNAGISTGCNTFLLISIHRPTINYCFIRLFFSFAASTYHHSFSHLPVSRTRTDKKRKADAVCMLSVSLSTITFGKHLRR